MRSKTIAMLLGACVLAWIGSGTPASAQTYPDRPVKLVVPFPAGGAADFHARLIAQKLSESTQQSFIVDNRSGAGGTIAADYVAKSAADGYTLLFGVGSLAVAPSIYEKLPYDIVNDFAPVSLVVITQNVLVVPGNSKYQDVRALLAAAKAQPGKLNYASSGVGATPHLSMALLVGLGGVDIVHVPYKGDTPALTDLLAGRVDMYFSTIAGSIEHIRAGRLRALGVSSRIRAAALPELPTLDEAGVPGYELVSWFGIMAPARTPVARVNLLSERIAKAVALPDVQEKFIAAGSEPTSNTPEAFHALIRESVDRFARIVSAAGIKAK